MSVKVGDVKMIKCPFLKETKTVFRILDPVFSSASYEK